jgi:2-polyprenyl-6-methoxyphenol hydroxylase-like FAD-dependent oxidoreductase
MSKISVLIVGAGPTGLLMAYKLARHGVAFRIIDNKPTRTQHSNAVAIQTRTLEIFKQLEVVDEFLKYGHKYHGIHFYDDGKEFAHVDFDCVDSVYPFIMGVPQSETERILNNQLEHLHHRVEWSRDLIDLTQNSHGVRAIIKHVDGVEEQIDCDWLIGCDGSHSTVRNESDFTFPGEDVEQQFVVADTKLSSSLKSDCLHIFDNGGDMLGVFPYGDGKYRIAANLNSTEKKECSEQEIKEIVDTRSRGAFQAQYASWISPFWIHSKLANQMRDGRIFIAGDAAHIHSPAGGQGMNTGLQDAYNLAWKLALVVQGRANPNILDSYEAERYPVIKRVVETTERMTNMILAKNTVINFLRETAMKLVANMPFLRKKFAMRMTQLDIIYDQSPIIDTGKGFSKKYPSAGYRAPDVEICQSRFLYDYLDDTHHHIVCFAAGKKLEKVIEQCKMLDAAMAGPYKDIVKLHLVTPELTNTLLFQIHDPEYAIHKEYNVSKPSLIIIRPDGYIGFKMNKINAAEPLQFLEKYISV